MLPILFHFFCLLAEGDHPISELSGETHVSSSLETTEDREGPEPSNIHDNDSNSEDPPTGPMLNNSYALLCCEDSITLYSLKYPIEVPFFCSIMGVMFTA